MEKTFSQEQINAIASCYIDEISRLLQVKANDRLIILDYKKQLDKVTKENAELKTKKEET
jgi:hypothetical protein